MPKLYTKTGDNGTTSLYDGNRIQKNEIFFSVLGDIDELSSHIGLLCSYLNETEEELKYNLRTIQVKLLDIGSNLAVVDEDKKKSVPKIEEPDIARIEDLIDEYESQNKPLTEFILPGVSFKDSQCHVCRSVSRRVERGLWNIEQSNNLIVGLKNIDMSKVNVDKNILIYINRLSDYFFALARNLSEGKDIKVNTINDVT